MVPTTTDQLGRHTTFTGTAQTIANVNDNPIAVTESATTDEDHSADQRSPPVGRCDRQVTGQPLSWSPPITSYGRGADGSGAPGGTVLPVVVSETGGVASC